MRTFKPFAASGALALLVVSLAALSLAQTGRRAVPSLARQQPTAPSLSPALVLAPQKSLQIAAPNQGVWDFGSASLLDRPVIEHTFVVQNKGTTTFSGLHLHRSCGSCLQAFASVGGKNPAPLRPVSSEGLLDPLGPGQEMTLHIVLLASVLPSGPVHKTVSLYAPGQPQPLKQIDLQGMLQPSVSFAPAFVDFGRLAAGQSRALTLRATLDPRLAPAGSVPRLYCLNPDVQVQPLGLEPGSKEGTASDARGGSVFAYRLTLSDHAALGPVLGTVGIANVTASPAAGKSSHALPAVSASLPPSQVTAALRSASASLSGKVEGDVSAQPATLAFGTVTRGQQPAMQIVLTPKSADTLKGMKINSGSEWLSARLAPQSAPPVPAGRTDLPHGEALEVIVSPKTPPGVLQSQLILTLANGQRLMLPVSVTVMAQDVLQ